MNAYRTNANQAPTDVETCEVDIGSLAVEGKLIGGGTFSMSFEGTTPHAREDGVCYYYIDRRTHPTQLVKTATEVYAAFLERSVARGFLLIETDNDKLTTVPWQRVDVMVATKTKKLVTLRCKAMHYPE